jgi:hypothetical protein
MNFINYLDNITYATKDQKVKELWDVEGIIKNKSNQFLKFDLRPLNKFGNDLGKIGNTNTKADKMVFEEEDKWVILDIKELHEYIKKHKFKKVYVYDLISKLDWNIFLLK